MVSAPRGGWQRAVPLGGGPWGRGGPVDATGGDGGRRWGWVAGRRRPVPPPSRLAYLPPCALHSPPPHPPRAPSGLAGCPGAPRGVGQALGAGTAVPHGCPPPGARARPPPSRHTFPPATRARAKSPRPGLPPLPACPTPLPLPLLRGALALPTAGTPRAGGQWGGGAPAAQPHGSLQGSHVLAVGDGEVPAVKNCSSSPFITEMRKAGGAGAGPEPAPRPAGLGGPLLPGRGGVGGVVPCPPVRARGELGGHGRASAAGVPGARGPGPSCSPTEDSPVWGARH